MARLVRIAGLTLLPIVALSACGGTPARKVAKPSLSAVIAGKSGWQARHAESRRGDLAYVMRADAVVDLSSFVATGSFMSGNGHVTNLTYDLGVKDVEFQATHDYDSGDGVAPLDAAQTVSAFESLGLDGVPSILAGITQPKSGTRIVALLDWHRDTDQVTIAKTHWSIAAAMVVDDTSHVTFVGADSDIENADLTRLLSDPIASKYSDAEELLVAWATEIAQYGVKAEGPITKAAANAGRPDPAAEWYRLPARARPLDDTQTPPEVLATLQRRPVILDIDPAMESAATVVRIVTDQGVSYGGTLQANYRVATIYTPKDVDWTLELRSFDPAKGATDVLGSATIPASLWFNDGTTLIHIESALRGMNGDTLDAGTVTTLSKAAATSWLSDRADAGTAGPEPPEASLPKPAAGTGG